jgi:seryl-tRNA(Sec) selenium transferase
MTNGDIYRRFGLEPVINAAGKMTALGGTAQANEIAGAGNRRTRLRRHRDVTRKRGRIDRAAITAPQAASVTTGAAAGIAIALPHHRFGSGTRRAAA